MALFAERWCDHAPGMRLGAGLLMVLLLTGVVIFFTHNPGNRPAAVPLKAQWKKVMLLRGPAGEVSSHLAKPFSALDFDGVKSRLLSWEPSGKRGELILEADWLAIPSLFNQLAERNQAVRAFSILPGVPRLTLRLQLEAIDDD
ncbi:hypothetical protein [Enterobacter sp. CC120223-11]|uniref:HofO family protein n=1 Tax=Enterobacter sp. CC120223-11 TaxID=1378073 RepID=UPI000BDD9CA1|nr:hypothetical protein [Enterobacter sp. CC120223-11]SNY71919.1 pilus assembly protein HofO [Enterobacter sp. CC120223-11]